MTLLAAGPHQRYLGAQFSELGNRNRTISRNRFAKRLDPLDFVHGLGSEVRLSTMGA